MTSSLDTRLGRRWLLVAGSGVLTTLAGCLGGTDGGAPAPKPDSLAFQTDDLEGGRVLYDGLFDPNKRALYLALMTDPRSVRRLDWARLDQEAKLFVEETDFSTDSLVLLQVSGRPTSKRVAIQQILDDDGVLKLRARVLETDGTAMTPVIRTVFVRVEDAKPNDAVATVVFDDHEETVSVGDQPSWDTSVTEEFSTGLAGWTKSADISEDADEATWSIEPVDGGLRFRLSGAPDGGAAWAVREIAIRPGQQYDATVTVHARPTAGYIESTGDLIVSLGPYRPLAESSFPAPDTNTTGEQSRVGGLREPLTRTAHSTEYQFEWSGYGPGWLFLAVGIATDSATGVTALIEDVQVELRAQ
jgi:hypothetical protein